MHAYFENLASLQDCKLPENREAVTTKAFKARAQLIADLMAGKKNILGKDSYRYLAELAKTYGDWVVEIPDLIKSNNDPKKLKKYLADLVQLEYLQCAINNESEKELLRRIQHAKTLKELDELKHGVVIQNTPVATLGLRLEWAFKRSADPSKNETATASQIHRLASHTKKANIEIEIRRRYLQKKNTADKVANILTGIVSSLGIGLTAGIAMVLIMPLIWPAIPVAAMVGCLFLFTLFGSFTEFFVYRGYVKTFCRQCARGFLGFIRSIDDRILNREAKNLEHTKWDKIEKKSDVYKDPYADKHDLTEKVKDALLSGSFKIKMERVVKKTLAIICIPIALASGIGFMGLIFSQITSAITLLNVASYGAIGAVAAVAAPWLIAVLVGPLFAIVMYGMLYKAVKNNLLGKMGDHIWEAFAYPFPKEDKERRFFRLPAKQIVAHLGKCFLKLLGALCVLGISVGATIFTARAWVISSVNFFNVALSPIKAIATYAAMLATTIGDVVGYVFTATNLFFSAEKSLKSATALFKLVSNTKSSNLWAEIKYTFSSPKIFFKRCGKGLLDSFFFIMHILGMAAVATQGKDALEATPYASSDDSGKDELVAGLFEVAEEITVDTDDVILHNITARQHAHPTFSHMPQYHGRHEKHDHEHGSVWKFTKGLFFSKAPAPVVKEEELRSMLRPIPGRAVG